MSSTTVTVKTAFGTYDGAQLKALKSAVDEAVQAMHIIDARKASIKDIIDKANEAFKVPKKILRRMIKVQYKQSFPEEVKEQKEFELIYDAMLDV
jgi:hypothetical protein